MYEDEPSDKVHDVLVGGGLRRPPARAGRSSAAPRSIGVGPGAGDRRVPRPPLRARRTSWSRRPATSTTTRIVELVERPSATSPRGAPTAIERRRRWRRAIALPRQGDRAVPPLPRRAGHRARRRAPLRAARCSTRSSAARRSSRLFQEVREKRGLAYSVYSYTAQYADTGQVGLYVGHPPRQRAGGDGGDRHGAEPPRRRAGVTDDELERARENVKGRTVLSMESTLARMNRLGGSLLMGVPLLTLDEMVARARRRHARRRRRAGPRAVAARAAVGRRRGRATRRRSARRSSAVSPALADSGVINVAVSGRGRADGARPSAARSRAPTTCRWSAAPTRCSRRSSRTCSATPTWSSTSRRPDTALDNARALPRGRACTA